MHNICRLTSGNSFSTCFECEFEISMKFVIQCALKCLTKSTHKYIQGLVFEENFQKTISKYLVPSFSIERTGIRIVFLSSKKKLENFFFVISKQNSTNFANFHRNFPIFYITKLKKKFPMSLVGANTFKSPNSKKFPLS